MLINKMDTFSNHGNVQILIFLEFLALVHVCMEPCE